MLRGNTSPYCDPPALVVGSQYEKTGAGLAGHTQPRGVPVHRSRRRGSRTDRRDAPHNPEDWVPYFARGVAPGRMLGGADKKNRCSFTMSQTSGAVRRAGPIADRSLKDR